MPTLYVTEPGATVRRRGDSLTIVPPPATDPDPADGPEARAAPCTVELHRLELVALIGRAHITTEALYACLDHGVSVALFQRNGRFRARLLPESARSADLRGSQYGAHQDADRRLERARGVVAAKAGNAAAVLRDLQSNDSQNTALPEAIARLKSHGIALGACASPESLLGWEGTVARDYFQALATAFRGPIGFSSRQRRPAPDPANALLSFGYVLLGNVLAGRAEARGLDPALGFYHEVRPGRTSLALDLLEELRHPVVDRFVLRACNLRILRPEHFEADLDRPGGVRLTRAGLKVFFFEWEKHLLRPLRDADADSAVDPITPDGAASSPAARVAVLALLDRQIERLVADLRGGPAYRPFRYGA